MIACGNADSCEPGTEHHFPNVGESVKAREDLKVREVGTTTWHLLRAEQVVTVVALLPQSHEVMINLNGHHLWINLDDIEQEWIDIRPTHWDGASANLTDWADLDAVTSVYRCSPLAVWLGDFHDRAHAEQFAATFSLPVSHSSTNPDECS
jgi:hypothetical protein